MFRINTISGHLLVINVLVWITTAFVLPRVHSEIDWYNIMSLHYWQSSDFNLAQIVSYMFLHSNSNFTHIFFNMWSLVLFGGMLEAAMGQKRFLTFYLVCGIGAALTQELTWTYNLMPDYNQMYGILESGTKINLNGEKLIENFDQLRELFNPITTVGASGAVFGLLVAFGMLFPERELFLMFVPIPIKAKYMSIGYIVIELFFGVKDFQGDNIAHYAHLGGALFGFLLIYYWKKKGDLDTYM